MTRIISFRVDGQPMPKGSKTAVAYRDARAKRGLRARVIEGGNLSKRTRALRLQWSAAISSAAEAAMNGFPPIDGAIEIVAMFYFVRPASARKRVYPSVMPDLDKLLRAALDPLKGVVFRDDALIVDASVKKRYTDGSTPYAVLTIAEIA